jgi:hypothetical protein
MVLCRFHSWARDLSQANISTHANGGWEAQWLRAADASVIVVCVLSESYTQSLSCVREWNSVANPAACMKRMVVGGAADNRALEHAACSGRLTTDEVR